MPDEHVRKCWELVDHLRGVLDQGWFYKGSAPGRDQSECRTTECSDLLGLVAELCADCRGMADELNDILVSSVALDMGTETLRKLSGVDLVALAQMYAQLGADLATAGNRALDTIGETYNGTERQQFGTTATEPQRLCSSGDERQGQAGEVGVGGGSLARNK